MREFTLIYRPDAPKQIEVINSNVTDGEIFKALTATIQTITERMAADAVQYVGNNPEEIRAFLKYRVSSGI